jgi:cardiolipin synthase
MEKYNLLTDGRAAFNEILRLCALARSSIQVNMFLWRDDETGNALARALLHAADRGVQVLISKDRFGGSYERAEESGQSFWNKSPDPLDRMASFALKWAMPSDKRISPRRQLPNELAVALRRHPNVEVDASRYKFDHTKYYIFDGKTLIFGGINVEDKEVGSDISGAKYHDFMVEVCSEDEVRWFRNRLSEKEKYDPNRPMDYIFNGRVRGRYRNGVRPGYLDFIRSAEQSLCVMMPYIGERRMGRALLQASRRGVDITFLIPLRANMQQDYNMLSAMILQRRSGGKIRFYLTPLMCHAKLMTADRNRVTLGSANLNRDGTSRGRQLNCVSREPALAAAAQQDFDETLAGAALCTNFEFSSLLAHLEGLFQG